MNATTQLALLTKARRVFETDGTFLSFPVLTPLAYPPEKLRFVGPGADLRTLGEFSRLVNQIPRGPLFRQEDTYLWDVYGGLFRTAEVAAETADPDRLAAYQRADAVLHAATPDGLRQDTPEYRAYKQCRDAWIAAAEEYKAARVTAETSPDPGVQAKWQADEPALRQKVTEAETAWATEGFRAQVEEAERVVAAYAERPSAVRLWGEWKDSLMQLIDGLTDSPLGGQFSVPTAFSPADAFDADWPKFTLSADEVAALVAQAPAELKDVLDLTGSGPAVDSVSFEFRSVGLNRPWLRPEVFGARFWRLPASEPPLSDGATPPHGSCPAYVTGVVFARNIVEVTKQPGGAAAVPVRTLPMLKLRAEFVRPPAPPPAAPAGVPLVRPVAAAPAAHVFRPGALSLSASPAARAAGAVQPAAASPAVPAVSPLARLNASAFTVRTGVVHAVDPPHPPPFAPPPDLLWRGATGPQVTKLQHALNASPSVSPKVAEDGVFGTDTERAVHQFQQANGLAVDDVVGPDMWARLTAPPSRDVTILAFICKWLPMCPDPDPSLTWTG